MKRELCQCTVCTEFRSKGITTKLTPDECKDLAGYATALMKKVHGNVDRMARLMLDRKGWKPRPKRKQV